jgi:hypothetical protein
MSEKHDRQASAGQQNKPASILTEASKKEQSAVSKQIINEDKKGDLKLLKVKIETTYNVCNDDTSDGDFKNFWMLESDGEGGKFWQWLDADLRYPKKGKDDGKDGKDNKQEKKDGKQEKKEAAQGDDKPNIIPITLHGGQNLKFKALFKVLKKLKGKPSIRAVNTEGYKFEAQAAKKTETGEEFVLEFSSSDLPFEKTIQHIHEFRLSFEYSYDQKNWFSFGDAIFCLYLTWKLPYYSLNKVFCSKDGKEYIHETLLWIGCEKSKGKIVSSGLNIAKNTFDAFSGKVVLRRREGDKRPNGSGMYLKQNFKDTSDKVNNPNSYIGMGYWRGYSTLTGAIGAAFRGEGNNILLENGEARCGEWSVFFIKICLAIGVYMDPGLKSGNQVHILSMIGGMYGGKSSKFMNGYANGSASIEFAVKNARFTGIELKTEGDSHGQGNPKAQPTFSDHVFVYYERHFFDPSYGYITNRSDLDTYCASNLSGIVIYGVTDEEMKAAKGKKQNDPVVKQFVETSNIHRFITASQNLFKN